VGSSTVSLSLDSKKLVRKENPLRNRSLIGASLTGKGMTTVFGGRGKKRKRVPASFFSVPFEGVALQWWYHRFVVENAKSPFQERKRSDLLLIPR